MDGDISFSELLREAEEWDQNTMNNDYQQFTFGDEPMLCEPPLDIAEEQHKIIEISSSEDELDLSSTPLSNPITTNIVAPISRVSRTAIVKHPREPFQVLNNNGDAIDMAPCLNSGRGKKKFTQSNNRKRATKSDKENANDNVILTKGQIAQRLRREKERALGLIKSNITSATNNQGLRQITGPTAVSSSMQTPEQVEHHIHNVTPLTNDGSQIQVQTLVDSPALNLRQTRERARGLSKSNTTSATNNQGLRQRIDRNFSSSDMQTNVQTREQVQTLFDPPTPIRPRNMATDFDGIQIDYLIEQPPQASTSSSPSEPDMSNLSEYNHIEYDFTHHDYEDDEIPPIQIIDGVLPRIVLPLEGQHYLGRMNVVCRDCGALHWMKERLVSSSNRNPKFGTCCKSGKVRLPLLSTPPTEFKALFDGNDELSKSFRQHIREYNASNAFTSLGCKMDQRTLVGRGPRSFTIHGELRHRTGALVPEPQNEPSYAQLYIFDPEVALDVRDRRNPRLNRQVLDIIQSGLLRYNAFVHKYRQAYEILSESDATGRNVPAYLHYTSSKDKRRYNLPSTSEIAVILPGDGTEISGTRDIVVHLKEDRRLMQISECHPAYLPLHYVLLFPCGDLGWEPEFVQWCTKTDAWSDVRLTQMQFFSFRLFQRSGEYSTILRGGKLLQEFIVDAWASTEQNRLRWVRKSQPRLRRDLYRGLTDIEENVLRPDQIGQKFVLPSSITGTPRNMYEIYQDSMAITRHNKHPDIFLTMTANPNWPEILDELLPFENANDHPELVTRVFELKRKCLMDEVLKNGVFGQAVAHVYTIEFQKRGLPHMHALIFLQHSDKIRSIEQVDRLISAEFPDESEYRTLFETVKRCMVHGPCGDRNKSAPCMENGKCTKRYPRAFTENTTMDRDGYPIYRRREDGREFIVRGKKVNNGDVVPYNPKLSKLFNCHINVEVCAGVRAVKYIHKYIYKGHDRTTMVLGDTDEIKQYLDARYIGPSEAAWRLFGYHLHEEVPTVVRLHLHLEGMHQCVFNPTDSVSDIQERAENQTSTLIEFFDYCDANPAAREYTYQEFPQHFTWCKNKKKWSPRGGGTAIGRMYFASPTSGERFYLRLLLTNVKGPRSWKDLRTVNGVLHDTFKSACVARGMLEDDGEWVLCLEEAAIMNTGYQLRRLFSIILIYCSPLEPLSLWNKFSASICDDLAYKLRSTFGIPDPTDYQVTDYGLFLLNELLQESGKSLEDFPPMTQPTENWSNIVGNRLVWEHMQLRYEGLELRAQQDADHLNDAQRIAYTAVLDSVDQNRGTTFFLNGGAGTGKTFLYNTIAATCRSRGEIVITVASSGIAALLLVGGRTAHSTFCIPLDILEDSICGFTKQSIVAELLRKTKLIIWDEVPMQHRFCVEAVNRTLQDVRDNSNPFGGLTVVLGGDFRQTLPVIPKGLREQIVGASLRRSLLWDGIHRLTLSQNMRLNNGEAGNADFAEFLLEIGSNPREIVQLPSTMKKCRNLTELILTVYPGLNVVGSTSPDYFTERTILSARNEDVSFINNEALRLFPGENHIYLAADKMNEDEGDDRFPNEYLNTLDPPGLPPFKLDIKIGCPIMLLRNLAPKDGLCNGTRLMVVQCAPHVIKARILTGDKAGKDVLIPRISLSPSSSDQIINMSRRQFPIRLAFAMTINKAQGQSVKFVGIDLRTPVFSHGQLYVALSRCTAFNRISVLLPEDDKNSTTTNVVYPEVI